MEEIWKEIKDYPDYKVSSLGNIKSLNYKRTKKEKILKRSINKEGYYCVGLCNNGISYTKRVHQLVAIEFLGHKPCGLDLVINHKDMNKLNNNVNNLEIVTMRENASHRKIKSTSKYVGVYWHKASKKWMASIEINGIRKYLGLFEHEIKAHEAYQKAKKKLLI